MYTAHSRFFCVICGSNRQCHIILFYDLFFIRIGLCLDKLSRFGRKPCQYWIGKFVDLSVILRAVSENKETAIPIFGLPCHCPMCHQFCGYDNIAGSGCDIRHTEGCVFFDPPVVEHIGWALKIAFVRSRHEQQSAISGQDICEIDKYHQVVAINFAIVTAISATIGTKTLARTMQSVNGVFSRVDPHISAV